MDTGTIMAAYNGLRFAKDALTTVAQGKIEVESQTRVLAALEKLGAAQDAMFEMRDELFSLQEQNRKLKQDLAESADWDKKLGGYQLVNTPGGAVVYSFKGQPEHFACPSCVNERELHILQDNRTMSGKFRCTGCEEEFPIKPRTHVRPGGYD